MWVYYAVLSAFFASLTALFAKVGVKGVDTDLATAIRTVVILLLAWGIVFFRGKGTFVGLTRFNLLFLVLSGVATGLSWIFYFKALQLGKVSQVAPIDKLSVALTILLGVLILREPVTVKEVVGAVMIIGGSLVMVL